MKKVTIILLICLIVCTCLAFPVSAAVSNMIETEPYCTAERILLFDTNYVPRLPTGYKNKYRIVLRVKGENRFLILYFINQNNPSSSPNPTVYYVYTDANPSTCALTSGTIQSESGDWYGNGTAAIMLLGGTNLLYDRIILNYCTATRDYTTYIINNYNYEVNLVPNVNITALETLLSTAKAKTKTGYTIDSWQALQTAITSADNLLLTTGYTQTQVDAAKNNLQAALNSLTLIPVEPLPSKPLLGYNLENGDVSGYFSRVPDIVYNYVLPVLPIAVGLFAIIFGLKIIPYFIGFVIDKLKR